MPQLTISTDAYEKLARRAADLNLTVEQFVTAVLERAAEAGAENGQPLGDLPDDQWQAQFDEFLTAVRRRAGRYPPSFQADVSRESIYEGCGE